MKHIFKKLHIGSSSSNSNSHDSSSPNRSNELSSSQPLSLTIPSDSVTTSGQSPSSLSSTTPVTVADRSDYYSSEEEFQLQLALAISASNSDFRDDPDKDQIRAATLLSLGRNHSRNNNNHNNRIDGRRDGIDSAESLSRRYWDYNVLDYMEKVVDGFYDIYGISTDAAAHGKMPSLADIQTDRVDPNCEVVMVNRQLDHALKELEQVAHCIALDCPSTNVELLVQRLADLVTGHMGGPVTDANTMLARWMERMMDLRTSLHTCILPIGSLNIGLSRHRALLFKVLADSIGVPCRLVKGSHYTGVEDDAVNIIKLENQREFLVDLMAAPGTLIPADFLSINNSSTDTYNPGLSESLESWATQDSGFGPSRTETEIDGVYIDGHRKVNIDNEITSDRKSNVENRGSEPSISSTSNGLRPVSIGNSSNEGSKGVFADKQLNLFSSSQYKGNNEGTSSHDVSKETYNIPYSQDMVDSKNLFADLNPFQMVGTSKTSAKNKPSDTNENIFHRQKDRLAMGPGRPPLPLVRKNRPANEVPKTKEYGFVEESSSRMNLEDKDYNTSIASSSSGISEKPYPNVNIAELPGSSTAGRKGAGDESFSGYGGSERLNSNEHDRFQPDGVIDMNQSLYPFRDHNHHDRGAELQNHVVDKTKDYGKNNPGKHDRRKYDHDRFTANRIAMDLEDKSSSANSGRSRSDSMLDDVAELEIPWEDLYIGERIGLGSYGEVYRADWNGMEVAVKKFLDQDFYGDALDEFRSEVRIMRRLRHPNVVLFVGAVTRPPNLSIVTEFLPRGSLYRILHRPNCQIDEKRRIKMALDVAMGMNCLHTSIPTIVHRDLKSLNLLVDDNWNVKVCDFGLSRLKHNTFLSSKSTAGTPEWMAPEVLRNEPSNEKCDVYSFGVILWELATLRLPWSGMNQMQVVGAVGFQNRRLDVPKELDPVVATIIRECWQTEPDLRPSFSQLSVALQSLQRLVIPSYQEEQPGLGMGMSQEIPVHITP